MELGWIGLWTYTCRTHIKHLRKLRVAWCFRIDHILRRVSTKHDELASDRMACVATHLHDVKGVGNINPTKHPTIRFRSLASKLFGGGEDYMKDGMVRPKYPLARRQDYSRAARHISTSPAFPARHLSRAQSRILSVTMASRRP